jgi:hypothetical protein
MAMEPIILEGGEHDGGHGLIREGESDYCLRRDDFTMMTYRRTRHVRDGRRVYRMWSALMPEEPDFEPSRSPSPLASPAPGP